MTDIIKQYQDKVDKMRWSFSRLNGWHGGCKYCWFQNYINKDRGGNNAFAEYGSLMHELLEGFCKGEIMYWDLEDLFINRFYEEVGEFPPSFVNLKELYFNQGIAYLKQFDGFQDYEILEIEPEIKVKIGKYDFIGYIDLLVRNRKNGKIIVIDHKSKAKFKNKDETHEYARQLYLYSKWVYEKYEEYPSLLVFNMFRKITKKTIIFKQKDYEEAQQWVIDTIDDIRNAKEFPVIEDEFFGTYLCNHKDKENHILGKNYTLEELWEG